MIILINRNMSHECVRLFTNRSDTPTKVNEAYHIKFLLLFMHCVFLYSLSQFLSCFKLIKPLDEEIFQLFLIVAPILCHLKLYKHCRTQYYKIYENYQNA